jgi:hypothetical protein
MAARDVEAAQLTCVAVRQLERLVYDILSCNVQAGPPGKSTTSGEFDFPSCVVTVNRTVLTGAATSGLPLDVLSVHGRFIGRGTIREGEALRSTGNRHIHRCQVC